MSKVGKLLNVSKKITGLTVKSRENFVHIDIHPGFYLIIDEVLDKDKNDIFIEILHKEKPVLIRIYGSIKNEIL
tara:strand:- start:110 stop:331 length:222 start_codon:yes stop_codon:yes gene_type:complete